MFRRLKLLLPALAIATLAGCATGYSYRGGNGDYYYGQPSVDYRYYGGYGYGYGSGGYGYGRSYYLDVFGRPVYGYPHGYYGGRYPGYPYGHFPRPPHGHDGDHDGDHDGSPPAQGGHRPGNRPPWRDIGRMRDRDEDEQARPRRLGQQPGMQPRMQETAPRVRPSAPMVHERSESRRASGGVRSGGSGERQRVRAARSSVDE
jgi:hypothetical protein